jgi:hypothetical protein
MNRLADEAAYFGALQDGVDSQRERITELEQQLAAKDEENTALKIQLLNRSVSNMESSANFALAELKQQLAEREKQIKAMQEWMKRLTYIEPAWEALYVPKFLAAINKEIGK